VPVLRTAILEVNPVILVQPLKQQLPSTALERSKVRVPVIAVFPLQRAEQFFVVEKLNLFVLAPEAL
jgi:hypothetical protein